MDPRFSETYLYKLHRLTASLDKTFGRVLQKQAGISLSRFTLLLAVDELGPASQRQVAAFLDLSPGAVSRQAEVCRQKGWIEVAGNAHDRRGQVLKITPEGKAAIKRGLCELENRVFSIFDEHDRQTSLMNHIDALLARVKEVDLE